MPGLSGNIAALGVCGWPGRQPGLQTSERAQDNTFLRDGETVARFHFMCASVPCVLTNFACSGRKKEVCK